MDPELIADLGRRFRQQMEEKRQARALAQAQSERVPLDNTHGPPQPNSHLPEGSAQQQQQQSRDDAFYQEVMNLANVPRRWEKPGLLDQALDALDLGKIYQWADEIEAEVEAEAAANSESDRPRLGHQDCVIKALMRYFKHEFFTWVNSPSCARCGGETKMCGKAAPTEEERYEGARDIEVYRCKGGGEGGRCPSAPQEEAETLTRFPRYTDPATLLTWRRGRCGEFANCFTLCCLALGSRARWVWNAEDHVWTEVWSAALGRWVHCDSCEEAFDQPQLYAVGWGKRMSYCLAFSTEAGARDVTRRYVRRPEHALPREYPEETLQRAIQDINDFCRSAVDAARLAEEEKVEERELASYVADPTATAPGEERPRQSGNIDWKETRGEMGRR